MGRQIYILGHYGSQSLVPLRATHFGTFGYPCLTHSYLSLRPETTPGVQKARASAAARCWPAKSAWAAADVRARLTDELGYFHLLKNMFYYFCSYYYYYFRLLVLKGVYHYWIFLNGS